MTQENCEPWRRPYNWRLREDPITDEPKENSINEKPTEGPITVKPKDNAINDDPKKILFDFLVMVYDRVGDGDKFSNENLGLGRPRFHGTNHLKIETQVFFS